MATANEIEPAKSSRFALGPVAWIPLAMAAGFVLTFVLLRDREGRLVLVELELVEPCLFFRHGPEAGERLARALWARL